jgi:hypothetical protein
MLNQPEIVLHRWRKPGDNARFQRFTSLSSSDAGKASTNLLQSSGRFADASSISITNFSLGFNFPDKWLQKLHFNRVCLYLRGQNVFILKDRNIFSQQTITPYVLSPLGTVTMGFQCSF